MKRKRVIAGMVLLMVMLLGCVTVYAANNIDSGSGDYGSGELFAYFANGVGECRANTKQNSVNEHYSRVVVYYDDADTGESILAASTQYKHGHTYWPSAASYYSTWTDRYDSEHLIVDGAYRVLHDFNLKRY